MAAIPVSSDEKPTNPRRPFALDQIGDNERRLKILERSEVEQRLRAVELFLFGP